VLSLLQALADAVAANGTLLEVDMAGNQGEAAIQSVHRAPSRSDAS
jgi:hypothetical protein